MKVEAKPKEEEQEDPEEFFENRILKPLPDFAYSADIKELALSI